MISIIDCGSSLFEELKQSVDGLGCRYNIIKMDYIQAYDFSPFSGIIISGSSIVTTKKDENRYVEIFKSLKTIDIPVLGICFGHQIIGLGYDSTISKGERIHRQEEIMLTAYDRLFKGIEDRCQFQEKHSEYITLPSGFILLGKSASCENEAMKHKTKPHYGVQFHPEASGDAGMKLFQNFLDICMEYFPIPKLFIPPPQ